MNITASLCVQEAAQAHRDGLLAALRPVLPHPKLRQERGRTVLQNHRQDQHFHRPAIHQQNQQQTHRTGQICPILIPPTGLSVFISSF